MKRKSRRKFSEFSYHYKRFVSNICDLISVGNFNLKGKVFAMNGKKIRNSIRNLKKREVFLKN